MATKPFASIKDTPASGQLVEHEGKTYETIREGKAYILVPPNARTSVNPQAKTKQDNGDGKDAPQGVFYNPIQQFNRDLSVLAIKAFGEDFCGKKRLQYEKDSGKQQARKERKRKRKIESPGEDATKGERAAFGDKGDSGVDGGTIADAGGKPSATENHGTVMEAHQEITGAEAAHTGLKRKAETQDEEQNETSRAAKLLKVDVSSTGNVAEALEAQQEATTDADQDVQHPTTMEDGTGVEPTVPRPHESTNQHHDSVMELAEAGKTADSADVNDRNTQTEAETQRAPQPWKPRFRILDALSATGLRALRYAAEIPSATAVTANDMDRNAVKSIRTHVEHNQLASKITASHANAIGHMYGVAFPPTDSHGPQHINAKYDVIDLDPYGTAAPFIDSALQALNDGGLLCVTCTDSGVLASCGYAEKTYALYGGMPIKGGHSHEGGLRLVISSVASAAAKYGLAVEPLLSLSIDFYVRMFIRVTKSPADVKFLAGKTMLVYGCDAGCGAWHTQMLGRNTRQTGKGPQTDPTFHFKHGIAQAPTADRLCEHCGSKMHVAGPMWAGPLHNAAFVEKVLRDAGAADKAVYQTIPRIEGMLDTALNELEVLAEAESTWRSAKGQGDPRELLLKTPPETVDPHPFFFIPSALAKVIHCIAPPEAAVKGALRHAGYRATRSHCKPGSVKTNAPWSVIWEVMREWVRQKQPIKEGSLKESHPGWKIMQAARNPEEVTGARAEAVNDGVTEGPADGTEAPEGGVTFVPNDTTEATDRQVHGNHTKAGQMKVVFDEVLGKDKPGRKLVRYQANPRENWGPMTRAKGSS